MSEDATPSSIQPKSKLGLKDRLNLMKSQRAEGSSSSIIESSADKGKNAMTTEERKKMLQRLRESRNAESSHKVDIGKDSDAEDMQSIDDSIQNPLQSYEYEIEDDEYYPLLGINFPTHISDQIDPSSTKLKKESLLPETIQGCAHAGMNYHTEQLVNSTTWCCSCASCCTQTHMIENPLGVKSTKIVKEWDGLRDAHIDFIQHEIDQIAEAIQLPNNTAFLPSSSHAPTIHHIHPEMSYLGPEVDGIFAQSYPVLAPVLLRSEPVPTALAAYVPNNTTYLSRMTQRVLREMHSLVTQLPDLNTNTNTNNNTNNSNDPLHTREGKQRKYDQLMQQIHYLRKFLLHAPQIASTVAITNGLKVNYHLSHAPNYSLPFDPVNHCYARMSAPFIQKGYGGRIGQWAVDSSALQRLGPLPRSFVHSDHHHVALFRMYLSQIYLTEHPLMNIEEIKAIQLMEKFQHYTQIYHEKGLEYLIQTMKSILLAMNQWIQEYQTGYQQLLYPPNQALPNGRTTNPIQPTLEMIVMLLNEDDYEELLKCYHQIVQLFPSLYDTSASIHRLSYQVYNLWKEIKEIRKRQSFVSTGTILKISRLRSNLSVPTRRRRANATPRGMDGHNPSLRSASVAAGEENNNNNNNAIQPTPRIDTARLDTARSNTTNNTNGINEWEQFQSFLSRLPEQFHAFQEILIQQTIARYALDHPAETSNNNTSSSDPNSTSLGNTAAGEDGTQQNSSHNHMMSGLSESYTIFTSTHHSLFPIDPQLASLPVHQHMIEQYAQEYKVIEKTSKNFKTFHGFVPNFVMQLSNVNEIVTLNTKDLPIYEQKRRDLLTSCQVKVILKINSQIVPLHQSMFQSSSPMITQFGNGYLGNKSGGIEGSNKDSRSDRTKSTLSRIPLPQEYYSIQFPGCYINLHSYYELKLLQVPYEISVELYSTPIFTTWYEDYWRSFTSTMLSASMTMLPYLSCSTATSHHEHNANIASNDVFVSKLYLPIPGNPASFSHYQHANARSQGQGNKMSGHGGNKSSSWFASQLYYTHNLISMKGGLMFTSPQLFPLQDHNHHQQEQDQRKNNTQFAFWKDCFGRKGEDVVAMSDCIKGVVYCALDFDPLESASLDYQLSAPHSASIYTPPYRTHTYEGVTTNQLAVYPPMHSHATNFSTTTTQHPSSPLALLNTMLHRSETGNKVTSNGTNSNNLANLIYDFTRENDFQALLPSLETLDYNAPQNEHLLYLKSKRSVVSDRDLFRLEGYDTIAPFKGQLSSSFYTMMNYILAKPSLRLQLLLIRAQKPYLFQNIYQAMETALIQQAKQAQQPAALAEEDSLVPIPSNTTSKTNNNGYFPSHPFEIPLQEEMIKTSEYYKQILQAENITSEQILEALPSTEILGKISPNMIKQTSFITRIRNSQTALSFRAKKLKLVTSSVVLEVDYTPKELSLNLFCISRRRELKPKIVSRLSQATEIQHCDLLIQVVGARNVPLKIMNSLTGSAGMTTHNTQSNAAILDATTPSQNTLVGVGVLGSTASQLTASSKKLMLNEKKLLQKKRVRSFVEVKFQDQIIATGTLEGNTPMWKQSLCLPFHPPHHDFTPFALDQVREDVYFTLFDEVVEDDGDRGGFLEGESTFRIEKYFLGQFAIPFHTIYHEGKVDGIFRMDFPVFNFGYENPNLPVMGIGTQHAVLGSDGMIRGSSSGIGGDQSSGTAPGSPGKTRARSPTLEELQQQSDANMNSPGEIDDLPNGLINTNDGRPNQLPTNRLVARSRTMINIFEYCFASLYDSCFCVPYSVKDTVGEMYEYMKLPFQPVPPSRELLESLYYRTKYISDESLKEFIYYASDDRTPYMKIMLTFDPLLPKANPGKEDISPQNVIKDDYYYAIYANHWLAKLEEISPATAHRLYPLFVTNASGLQMLICRYLFPQRPPIGFESYRGAIHLVSMMPFLKDVHSFLSSASGDQLSSSGANSAELDIWCTNAQFWELGAGDEEEHAILLYNYFRYLIYHQDQSLALPSLQPNDQEPYQHQDEQETDGLLPPSRDETASPGIPGVRKHIKSPKKVNRSTPESNADDYHQLYHPTEDFMKQEKLFLVLGKAFPEGDTVYVMYRDPNHPMKQLISQAMKDNHDFQAQTTTTTPWGSTVSTPWGNLARLLAGNTPWWEALLASPDQFLFINPVTGHIYSAIDPYCPLKEIFCLVTPYNLWANIQETTNPSELMYDLWNPTHWRSFFHPHYNPMQLGGLKTIQEDIRYLPTPSDYASNLETILYQQLRNSIRKWRSKRKRSVTTFHPEASNVMSEMLQQLEAWKKQGDKVNILTRASTVRFANTNSNNQNNNNNKDSSNDSISGLEIMQQEIKHRLSSILRTRTLRGIPLNLTYTDINEIVQKVKTLAIHEANHPEIQFVLAVKAFPLYNHVLSLWIFFGTLEVNTSAGYTGGHY